jgi:hypothetical protein
MGEREIKFNAHKEEEAKISLWEEKCEGDLLEVCDPTTYFFIPVCGFMIMDIIGIINILGGKYEINFFLFIYIF